MKQLIEDSRRAIKIFSSTPHGNEELANFLADLCQDRGMKVNLQQVTHSHESVSKRQFNLISILGDPLVDKKTSKGLLLVAHLDTATPGLAQNWTETQKDPLSPVVKDGKVYGLGAVNSKLAFLAMLYAVEKFRERKLLMPIYLVGTCGGEMGGFGSRYLIKSLALNPRYVLINEPSELRVVSDHKALVVYKVSVDFQSVERDAKGFNRRVDLNAFGVSAHGAHPTSGKNAIGLALDFVQSILNSGFEVRFTGFEGGDAKNKVPDQAKIGFFLTSHQFEDFKRFFRERLQLEGKTQHFTAELGGLGDSGVKFLPEAVFGALMDAVQMFRALAREFESKTDPRFTPAFSTINFSQIAQRPSGVDLYYDVRLLPGTNPDELHIKLTEELKKVAARVPQLNVSLTRERSNQSLSVPVDSEWLTKVSSCLEAAGLPSAPIAISQSTEAAFFNHAGFKTVALGPGVAIGNSHCPNEHISVEALEKAITFYQKLIERTCT